MQFPEWFRYIILPLLGGFVGFITNWIAITLLFRPHKKIFGIQGLLEKRKDIIAQKAAEVIRLYLLNTQELKKVIDKEKVKVSISKLVDNTLGVIPKFGRKLLSKVLRNVTYAYFFDKDGYIKDEILELAVNDTELESIIAEKIKNYDMKELERIIKSASSTEINFILWSGAVLGLIVGIIEALLPF